MNEATDGKPAAFYDFPKEAFPFTVTAYAPDGEVVWAETVTGPCAIEVPGTGPGSVARVVMTFANGEVVDSDEPDLQ